MKRFVSTFVVLLLINIVVCWELKFRSRNDVENDESIVQTQYGLIQGSLEDDHRAFLGIPFAKPPIGNLRWSDPIPIDSWGSSVYDATRFAPGCAQDCELPPYTCPVSLRLQFLTKQDELSEDCLYLNVYTPRFATPTDRFPVMAFLPGGRFEQGSPATVLYSGEWMANHTSTVLVTVAYRLGALGFLLTDDFKGNFALSDQRLALQWIKNNIAYFGGNPNSVTLFGQSAGASSTACHLISPLSYNLFDAAILESNPITLVMKPIDMQKKIAKEFAKTIGCDFSDSACLRSKNISEIINAQKIRFGLKQCSLLTVSDNAITWLHPLDLFYPWTPAVDGYVVPMQPIDAFVAGKYYNVPLIFGTVMEEAWLFIYQLSPTKPITEAEYIAIVTAVFGVEHGAMVLDKYPPKGTDDARPLMSQLGMDYIFYCPTRYAIKNMLSHQLGKPIYMYQFQHVTSFDPWGPDYAYCVGKICHGSELPFVFNKVEPYYEFDAQEQQLANDMATFWTNFAWSAGFDVNQPHLVTDISWNPYDPNQDEMIVFDTGSNLTHIAGWRSSYCDFFDSMRNPYHYGT